jgi:hypothetical protein
MNSVFGNLMNFRNNPHASWSIYGAALIEILKIWFPHYDSQLSGTQKVLTWYGILAATTTGGAATDKPTTPDQKKDQTMTSPKTPLLLLLVTLLASFIFTGCTSSSVVGHVVSVTERGFGIQVEATTSTTQTPKVRLGFFSSTVFLEPVTTNAVFVPSVANTFAIDNTAAPFSFGVNEAVASGNYQAGNTISATNPIAAQPIVPK